MILYLPIAAYRCLVHSRYRRGWGNRFGNIKRLHPDKKCIWLHAVSLGEINASRTIVDYLCRNYPNYEVIISTNTDTGMARAESLFGERLCLFYFPFDFSFISKKVFKALNPSLILLVELEVWVNLVDNAYKNNIPVVVINGRLSDKSFPKYLKIRKFVKPTFEKISFAAAQTEEYAQRFIELGCDSKKTAVCGSLKYDTAEVSDSIEGADKISAQFGLNDKKLITAGSTGDGEEELVLDIYKNLLVDFTGFGLRLAVVPRKPERFEQVEKAIIEYGFNLVKFSEFKGIERAVEVDEKTIILVDTMGDLRKFYSLASINFVGRSLVPMGGSDMIESAALGKFTIFGKFIFNFRQDSQNLLERNGAVKVDNPQQLYEVIKKALRDIDYLNLIAGNGRNVILANKGATEKTSVIIKGFLEHPLE